MKYYNSILAFTALQASTQASAKKDDETMSVCFDAYPGYTGDLNVAGSTAVVKTKGTDSLKVIFDLKGVEAECTDCGLHIHTGTTCATADEVGGHYWDASVVEDQWLASFGAVYNADEDGEAKGNFKIVTGYGYEENLGHAVVIHASDGSRIGCGVLSAGKSAKRGCGKAPTKLEACVSTFDAYTGELTDVKGRVKVKFDKDGGSALKFEANLKNADADCETCGIHIHTGTSCEDASAQGGHYWTPTDSVDPWTTAGGAIYTSNSNGKGKANFELDAGTTIDDNTGKVVVVHDSDGNRYACGVLSTEKAKKCMK